MTIVINEKIFTKVFWGIIGLVLGIGIGIAASIAMLFAYPILLSWEGFKDNKIDFEDLF